MKYSIAFILILGLSRLQAQEALTTTGGNASGSGGSASYSVGQVVYSTNTGINGSVAQGVQQPFEISIVNGLRVAEDVTLHCTAYPNPTKDYLILKVENIGKKHISYQLYDINGKILEHDKLEGNETSIVMSNLVPSTYFLKVIDNKKEVKAFKIVKN